MASRLCTECGASLEGKSTASKTCSPKCRAARSRRLKREEKERNTRAKQFTPEQRETYERVRGEQTDVAHKVIEEEIRPVVRESITEDTLKAIAKMVGLTSTAVAALEEDLSSENSTIRQRAYTLIMKYTVGHPALVQPTDQDTGGAITVNFALPRPGHEGEGLVEHDEPEVVEATVIKTCDTCGEDKPEDQFAAASTRCLSCYEKQRNRAHEMLSDHAN